MLELRHLRVLRAIAREGSLAAAARALHFSQPTVTHHLATLEAHLRTPLVHRGARGAVLTDAGRALLPHAEAVLERILVAEREVRDLAEDGAATLRIGTFPTAGALLLPPAVRELHRQGVRISLTEGEMPTLLAGLRTHELQAALVFHQPAGPDPGLDPGAGTGTGTGPGSEARPGGHRVAGTRAVPRSGGGARSGTGPRSGPGAGHDLGEEFTVHPLLDDPLLLVLPADHPLARRERVPLAELRGEDWIMSSSDWDPVDRALARACARHGFQPVPAMRTDDYAVIQGFVAAGIGVALVPRLGLAQDRPDLAVRPVEGRPMTRRIGLAVLNTSVSANADALLAALAVQAERLRADWAATGPAGA
ncbi:LysR family transcriptional regulator [Kitasatospora sp. NPDC054939]